MNCKEDSRVTDINKIMKSITPEYKRQKIVDGVLCDTYFFKDFTGYDHPLHMYGPLSYAETQNRDFGYLEASLDTSGDNPLLILVESYFVKREPIIVERKQISNQTRGDVYYVFHRKGNQQILDKEVILDDTFGAKEYVHVFLDEKGNIVKSEIARKDFEWSYQYKYDERGLLIRRTTKRNDGYKAIHERGKDF